MCRLLIVDDEPEYLDELTEALAFEGLEAIAVARGADAMAVLDRVPTIAIVLTDIRMPDMDGVAFIHAARMRFGQRRIAFVVMTGHAAEEDIARAHTAGAVRCFPKPLDFSTLCDVLLELDGARHAG